MKNALMVWGGWSGHTPEEATTLIAAQLKTRGFTVTISDTLDAYLDADAMQAYDLIVQCVTMAEITPEQCTGLIEAVKSGTGFAGWHGGIIDSFRNQTEYHWMTGGQWVAHPGNLIPSQTVNIAEPDHEITKGLSDFELTNTEQYYIHYDPAVHVLCTTTFSGEHGDATLYPAGTVMPYAWTRQFGAGRVFVACWGHTDSDFTDETSLEIVLRGLSWASR